MRAEVVHKEVVRVVHEEVQRVEHVSIVLQDRYLQGLFDDRLDLVLCLLSVVNKFDRLLLILLSQQVGCLFDQPLRCFQLLLQFVYLSEEGDIVFLFELRFL